MAGGGGQAGFCGKLPSRGDHLARGLPRGFTDPWNAWLDRVLPAARDTLGEAWRPAWMEAPIWRFVLPGGQCGPAAVVGLWMPSVDRVGRLFPLTLAWVAEAAQPPADSAAWLEAAEQAGLAALESGMTPEALLARLAAAPPPQGGIAPPGPAGWWTDGSPRVPPSHRAPGSLPDGAMFADMILDPRMEKAQ